MHELDLCKSWLNSPTATIACDTEQHREWNQSESRHYAESDRYNDKISKSIKSLHYPHCKSGCS